MNLMLLAVAIPEWLQGVAWATIGTGLIDALLAIYGAAAIAWLAENTPGPTKRFFAWVRALAGRVHNQFAAGILQRLSDLILQKVLALEQTEIQVLKDQAAAGKLDMKDLPELLAKVKQKGIDAAKADANAQGLLKDALALFGGSDTALGKWMSDVLEAHVGNLPVSGLQTVTDEVTTAPAVVAVAAAVPVVVAAAEQKAAQVAEDLKTPVVPQPAAS